VAEAKKKSTTRQPTSAVNDVRWRDVKKILPAAADWAIFRNRLEQIEQAKASPEQLAVQQEAIASQCDNLRALLETQPNQQQVAFLEELTRHRDDARKQAAMYRRAGKVKRPHFVRQCELLWLWEGAGGDLGYSTPRKGPPKGPVIRYFQAASKAVFGKAPKPDQIKKIVIEYQHLNFSAARISSESGVLIDDSKISILREGKLLRAGEKNLPENQPELLRAARERNRRP
jgi:hypothetical protein